MPYVIPPDAVLDGGAEKTKEHLAWHEQRAREDLTELAKHKGWKVKTTWTEAEHYLPKLIVLHAIVLEGKSEVELRWSTSQRWYRKTERNTWGLLPDDRKGPEKKIQRG